MFRVKMPLVFILSAGTVTGVAGQNYEAYYLYLGNNPSDLEADWTDEAQGLAHDDTHWYISQRGFLWRVPVDVGLNAVSISTPGVIRRSLSSVPKLTAEGYDHFGDISVHRFGQTDYLLVPIEGGAAGLAVYVADSLTYIDHAAWPQQIQTHSSWVGVDEVGNVYGSNYDPVQEVYRYTINWLQLLQSGTLSIQYAETITLRLEDGVGVATLRHVQGGEFTADGGLLYLVADGIHVFDTFDWLRVQQSTNGSGHFDYEFHTGIGQEPEGITIWEFGDAPELLVRGQLHVLLLDNDIDSDNIYLKHYTRTIRVDGSNAGSQNGTPEHPFRTVREAMNLAWDESEIRIRAHDYDEMMTISKRVRLTAEGGTVRIGG